MFEYKLPEVSSVKIGMNMQEVIRLSTGSGYTQNLTVGSVSPYIL